jgi:sugar/nucleoside kinase (ribokinase family)
MPIKTSRRPAGSNTRFDAVVVGATGIDTNIYLQGADIDFSIEANFTEDIDYVGQVGGYAARGFAKLGKRTALISPQELNRRFEELAPHYPL